MGRMGRGEWEGEDGVDGAGNEEDVKVQFCKSSFSRLAVILGRFVAAVIPWRGPVSGYSLSNHGTIAPIHLDTTLLQGQPLEPLRT